MSKQALGRGLGELMDAANKALPNLPPSKSADTKGLGQIVQRGQTPAHVESKPAKFLPFWFLLVCDLLLLGLTMGVVYFAPKPLSTGTILFCLTAITLGAVLSVLGILRNR